MTRTGKLLLCLLALSLSAGLLGACGGDDAEPAAGTPENPMVAKATGENDSSPGSPHNEASGPVSQQPKPGYQRLLQKQTSNPESRFTPCNLVTSAQAEEILGTSLRAPVEAPQGPTCIYRSRDAKRFVTVALGPVDFERIKPRLRKARSVAVSDRTAYCGHYGQQMLYLPLSAGQVLSIAGPCDVARQFALEALQQLPT